MKAVELNHCLQCGTKFPAGKECPVCHPTETDPRKGGSSLNLFGALFLIGGLSFAGYALFIMEVSIPGSGVVNLNMMNNRQNYLIAGLGLAIIGAMFFVADKLGKNKNSS